MEDKSERTLGGGSPRATRILQALQKLGGMGFYCESVAECKQPRRGDLLRTGELGAIAITPVSAKENDPYDN